ncbi:MULTISPECIES: DUF4231 domain-containing protein [unclassified Geodermatophilus]|uniref:DUF4231 domain-containing protein n=1 Tax=unclassified Geodermatophilus TaxID=2637632 RepID=UPI003EEAE23F
MSAAAGRGGGRSRRRPEDWRDLTGRLPAPCHDPEGRDLLWQQFEARLRWYDRAAARSRRACLALKTITLAAGATVTVLAAAGAPAVLTASLAAGAVVAEGIEQVFQLHPHWISYRSTAETLRQHGFSFAAGVVPYDVSSTRRELLNSVLWAVTSKENADWAAGMRGAAPPSPPRTADDEPATHA